MCVPAHKDTELSQRLLIKHNNFATHSGISPSFQATPTAGTLCVKTHIFLVISTNYE